MFPDLISIGPLTLHTYGLLVAVGFTAAILVAVRLGRREGFQTQQILDMGFVLIFSAIIGSRLMYVILNVSHYRSHPLDALKIWEGGMVFSGGLIAAALAILWHLKRRGLSFWTTADLWSPALALGQAVGRIGCFMAGCCYGKPTDQPWGVVFTHPRALAPLNVSLHPTQLYSAMIGFAVFGALWILHTKKRFQGQVFLWFLILHSTGRLFVERFRGDHRGLIPGTDMSITQLVTLLILVGAVVALYIIKTKQEESSSDKEV